MQDNGEWVVSFYQGFFDQLQIGGALHDKANAEVDFILGHCQPPKGARVLDIPCGTGRLSVELASRGYDVCGIDFNPSVLDKARQLCAERNVQVELQNIDMRQLCAEHAFDLAVCYWSSFGYFSDADNAAFLRSVAQALKPGGHFVLELISAEYIFRTVQTRGWTRWQLEGSQRRVLEERHYSPLEGRVHGTWTMLDGERELTQTSSIRLYTCKELVDLCQSAGFTKTEAFDPISNKPFDLESQRLALIATR